MNENYSLSTCCILYHIFCFFAIFFIFQNLLLVYYFQIKMVLIAILGYFLTKGKTRVFPYIIWVCELFSTTLLIFASKATWLAFLKLFPTAHSLISFKNGAFITFIFQFIPANLQQSGSKCGSRIANFPHFLFFITS